MPVLKYSLDRHFNKLFSKVKDINNSILDRLDDNTNTYYNKLINKFDSLNYFCDVLSLKETICKEFYKQERYYLDEK